MNHRKALSFLRPPFSAGRFLRRGRASASKTPNSRRSSLQGWLNWTRKSAACLFGLAILLGACAPPEPEPGLIIDLSDILPEEWQAVSKWEHINIDADSEHEYLLFYRYDASTTADGEAISGPIGAVIYDPQTPAGMSEESEESARPPAPWLQPYALLPNYWQGSGYGFVAPPRQSGRPQWSVVQRQEQSETDNRYFEILARDMPSSASEQQGDLPSHDELIVYGGNSPIGGPTYISIFWWSTLSEGYGSTQISAPGGLHIEEWDGEPDRSPIRTVRARYPQYERSILCKESRFHRRLDSENTSEGSFRAAIYYEEGARKLVFCYGIPDAPFYPEAVVLAYLLEPDHNEKLLSDEALPNVPHALGNFAWVDALQYLASIPTYVGQAETSRTITTTVWASLVYRSGGSFQNRVYAFTLEHVPSDLSSRTTDQWRIVDVQSEG